MQSIRTTPPRGTCFPRLLSIARHAARRVVERVAGRFDAPSGSRRSRGLAWLLPLAFMLPLGLAPSARGEEIVMKDGRILEGQPVPLASMVGDRLPPAEGVKVEQIIMVDSGLKRIFVPFKRIRDFQPGASPDSQTDFKIKQQMKGQQAAVNNVRNILQITPFDEHGRRTFTLSTTQGNVNVIQGITHITPKWTRVDGLNYIWDMRIATNSIPTAQLKQILGKVIEPTNEAHRREYAQLLIQIQRYGEAKDELEQILVEFPALRDRVTPVIRSLTQLRARQILTEIEVRRAAGQFQLVRSMIEQFPINGVAGEILQSVRILDDELAGEGQRGEAAWQHFHRLLAKVSEDERQRLLPIRDEIFGRRPYLLAGDVKELVTFCSGVVSQWQDVAKIGRQSEIHASPSRRLYRCFDDATRKLFVEIAKNGAASDDEARTVLWALNAMLLVPDFYTADDFASIALTEETRVFADSLARLSQAELMRFNRLLLEQAYPDHISPSTYLGLTSTTLERLEAFLQFADDETQSPQDRLALAVSGWLVGSNSAKTNLVVALSLWEARRIVRDYLTNDSKNAREQLLSKLRGLEGSTAENLAKLLANMTPPVDTQLQEIPGFFEFQVPTMQGHPNVTYYVQLPPEYDPYRKYPTVISLHGSASVAANSVADWVAYKQAQKNPMKPSADGQEAPPPPTLRPSQIDWWAGTPSDQGIRSGQSMRYGYIVIAPVWGKPGQQDYNYSAFEHAAVLAPLRDACRRFSIDTDRVYLQGHGMGGDAVWDIGLAHPDLWAGVIPIVGMSDKYTSKTWENGRLLSMYCLGGELDPDRVLGNAREYDRFMKSGFDITVAEYRGRGYEHFSEDLLEIFDWMKRRQRDFFPTEFETGSMRPWDNYFWWLEVSDMPDRGMVLPQNWAAQGKRALPIPVKGSVKQNNTIYVQTGANQTTVWLSPEMIDFGQRIDIKVNGRSLAGNKFVEPSIEVLLEDARTRADRQHPFWAKLSTR